MREISDEFGRTFKTLRVSLINTCNLACVYCTCGTEDTRLNHSARTQNGLSAQELSIIIARLHQHLDLETIRFTGGEPLLYCELTEIVKSVKALGIKHLKLTTNGLLLEGLAGKLAAAGITSINVSLDAIDEDVFFKVSCRKGVQRVLKGIDEAVKCGIDVKLNAVIMKGFNENQILPLLNYAFEKKLTIRFLEIMAMGHLYGTADQHFISQAEILRTISSKYTFRAVPRKFSATANYWKTSDENTFGIVANESEPFCSDCNRLRLDSMGNIYGCLSSNHPVSLQHIPNDDFLHQQLQTAMYQKQALKFTGSNLSMLTIGG